MFAADCPTKRAAFMTDMTPGRWSHVPALVHQLLKLLVLGCLGKLKVPYDMQVQFRFHYFRLQCVCVGVCVCVCACVCVVPSSIKNRLSNYGPATTAQQPTLVPLHQPQLSNYGSATNPGFASATTAQQPQSSSIPSHCLNLALLHVTFLNSQALPFQEFLSRFKVSVYLNLPPKPYMQ